MLLYDLVKRQGYRIPECPVFEITNVARFCEEAKSWSEWSEKELTRINGAFPPFHFFWMEHDQLFNEKPIEYNGSIATIPKIGCLFAAYKDPTSQNRGWRCCSTSFEHWNFTRESTSDKRDFGVVSGFNPIDILRGKHLPQSYKLDGPHFSIDSEGAIGDLSIAALSTKKAIQLQQERFADDFSSIDPETLLSHNILIPLQAMMFMSMHSKCVRISDRQAPRGERRRAEREGKPLSKFKVIEIRPVSGRSISERGEPSGQGYSEHIVRGYRATYTKENGGLFGKYPGTFWFSPKIRGDKTIGTVEKMYQVSV